MPKRKNDDYKKKKTPSRKKRKAKREAALQEQRKQLNNLFEKTAFSVDSSAALISLNDMVKIASLGEIKGFVGILHTAEGDVIRYYSLYGTTAMEFAGIMDISKQRILDRAYPHVMYPEQYDNDLDEGEYQ